MDQGHCLPDTYVLLYFSFWKNLAVRKLSKLFSNSMCVAGLDNYSCKIVQLIKSTSNLDLSLLITQAKLKLSLTKIV